MLDCLIDCLCHTIRSQYPDNVRLNLDFTACRHKNRISVTHRMNRTNRSGISVMRDTRYFGTLRLVQLSVCDNTADRRISLGKLFLQMLQQTVC